jgi:hypothetical protein
MITAARCKELAHHYKALSATPRISESRAFLLRNIARSLTGLAGQLERLDAVTRAEVRGDDQVRVEKEAHPAVEVWDGPRKVARLAREKSNDLQR